MTAIAERALGRSLRWASPWGEARWLTFAYCIAMSSQVALNSLTSMAMLKSMTRYTCRMMPRWIDVVSRTTLPTRVVGRASTAQHGQLARRASKPAIDSALAVRGSDGSSPSRL